MKRLITKIKVLVSAAILVTGCTDLEEEQFGRLSPDTYYRTEEEALSSVVGIYQQLSYVVDIGDPFRIAEFGTDEFIVPGRASGGWFDQNNIDIMLHQVKPDNATTGRAWGFIFQEIGTANAVLESLESSPNKANFPGVIAEARALRAYGYFYAMDFWGNVPIFTQARVDPNNLPTNNTRTEVFQFVEKEMLQALNDLPSVNTVTAAYYPRLTKEAVYAALATLYLNAEVYTGTPKWAEALAMADNVINSGAYSLEPQTVDNFKATNEVNSTEIISSFSVNPTRNAGANQFMLYAQPALDKQRYNLPFSPANGYSTYQEALDRYEAADERRSLIQQGPQTYPNGQPLVDSKGEQLVLVPVVDYVSAQDNEGFRVLKYVPEGVTWSGFNADNDLVLIRYADILLIKAEALFRTGNSGEALTLVNQVRTRSNATPLTTLTLKNIEEERAREFIWEGHRRRDMIRFGSYFTETWTFKTTQTPTWRGIYPIPAEQIVANPNLKQNPNY
ncbi:RagB/SusD family nutrient uptake outer membrane protein [Rufibacter hautae]|uniref:RagB/SusD family nutrient uptake outer membrane protein n=1 Tax=Rufibacter hautae TaxID=2595005 RepID=A0A5B6TDI2_9BACT|nr:RagB/SusD family nutrient uptake outer membrane protein [Rufibacter hautae]KAA3437039.1 RagB/SusD family nutrient uptake outer membrane protein [Rufibacter hautae]